MLLLELLVVAEHNRNIAGLDFAFKISRCIGG